MDNPQSFVQEIRIEEPMIIASLITPEQYVGSLMRSARSGGASAGYHYITKDRAITRPAAERDRWILTGSNP
jgi:translation elongation factor EF-4